MILTCLSTVRKRVRLFQERRKRHHDSPTDVLLSSINHKCHLCSLVQQGIMERLFSLCSVISSVSFHKNPTHTSGLIFRSSMRRICALHLRRRDRVIRQRDDGADSSVVPFGYLSKSSAYPPVATADKISHSSKI